MQTDQTTKERIRQLCQDEEFAVLATQGESQPYTSLVAFAASPDLKYIAFATPKATKKYHLIEANKKVAFMVDDRASNPGTINEMSALTITGEAEIIQEVKRQDEWGRILLSRHPYLSDFVKASSTAIVVVEVSQYMYVEKFQEVSEWTP